MLNNSRFNFTVKINVNQTEKKFKVEFPDKTFLPNQTIFYIILEIVIEIKDREHSICQNLQFWVSIGMLSAKNLYIT